MFAHREVAERLDSSQVIRGRVPRAWMRTPGRIDEVPTSGHRCLDLDTGAYIWEPQWRVDTRCLDVGTAGCGEVSSSGHPVPLALDTGAYIWEPRVG